MGGLNERSGMEVRFNNEYEMEGKEQMIGRRISIKSLLSLKYNLTNVNLA